MGSLRSALQVVATLTVPQIFAPMGISGEDEAPMEVDGAEYDAQDAEEDAWEEIQDRARRLASMSSRDMLPAAGSLRSSDSRKQQRGKLVGVLSS